MSLRVDGDVAEVFRTQGFSHRYLLAFLTVQVRPGPVRDKLAVRMTSAPAGSPLYQVLRARDGHAPGAEVEDVIAAGAEPLYRQFFTQVAQLCGRTVAT